jgi:hypothetical protein
VFEQRRPATHAEIEALLASFDVINPPAVLHEAEVSTLATLEDLGAAYTVLAVPDPPPGGAVLLYGRGGRAQLVGRRWHRARPTVVPARAPSGRGSGVRARGAVRADHPYALGLVGR